MVLTLAAVAGLCFGLFFPAIKSDLDKSRKINCASNLKQINLAVRQYAMDYNDCFPIDLQVLLNTCYIMDPHVFICPARLKHSNLSSSFTTDYIYLGAGLKESDRSDIPIVIEDPRNHGNYINIMEICGVVQGYNSKREMTTTSYVEILNELYPSLDRSWAGRIVLENAKKADKKRGLKTPTSPAKEKYPSSWKTSDDPRDWRAEEEPMEWETGLRNAPYSCRRCGMKSYVPLNDGVNGTNGYCAYCVEYLKNH